jgi:methionyl-tRNA formyltransferase
MAPLNIVFMGTPLFATTALKELAADKDGRYSVRLVLTRPDAASGRGKTLVPSPVRVLAEELGIPVETPRSFYAEPSSGFAGLVSTSDKRVVDPDLFARIAATDPDFIIVAAYGAILPREILDLPRYGCINIHGSLLPRWRGAAPIQRAILAGDAEAGVSIMRMEPGLDTGPYCAVAKTPLGEKNTEQLTAELAQLGANLLVDTLPRIAAGTAPWTPQDETLATYADKVEKSELFLDPSLPALENIRRVRASSPQSPARCLICNKPVTVTSVIPSAAKNPAEDSRTESDVAAEPPVILSAAKNPAEDSRTEPDVAVETSALIPPANVQFFNKHLILATPDGTFEVTTLKPDGKNAMSAAAFAAGIKQLQKNSAEPATWHAIERTEQ